MSNTVRRIGVSETCLGQPITAEATLLPSGVHVSVYGGELPHIGAVSIVDADGKVETTQFPGHKDGIVSGRWAEALLERSLRPVVVVAGIHYDALSASGIREVLKTTDRLLEQLLEGL